jgi:hypothetical protein
MIQYEELSSKEREEFEKNIALFDREVYEYLYYYLNGSNSPYEGYHADGVLSPREACHNDFFAAYKVNTKNLLEAWKPKLETLGGDDVFVFLARVEKFLSSSKDMVELTWVATQLYQLVGIHIRKQKAA